MSIKCHSACRRRGPAVVLDGLTVVIHRPADPGAASMRAQCMYA